MTDVESLLESCEFLKTAEILQLSKFLHACVDDLIEKNNVCFDNYYHYYSSDVEWTKDDLEKARKAIQKLYRESCIKNKFQTLKNLNTKVQEEIENCYKLRKNDIFEALIKESLIKNNHNLVENFNWKLKWIMGTSKLASQKESLLQLEFFCKNKNGENVLITELNVKDVDKLISELKLIQ